MKPPFERLVAEHGATVLRVARAVVGPVDADDVWSETFLAALRAYPGLPAEANVEAWLVTIAHRKAVDAVRSARLRAVPVEAVPVTGGSHPCPGVQDDGAIWSLVAALPIRQRQAIAYHYLGGMPYAQVAELVGGSADAARRAAADGMRTLRRLALDPEQEELR